MRWKNLRRSSHVRDVRGAGGMRMPVSIGRGVTPDSFTHGSAADRQRWLTTGLRTGDPSACDTFN